MLVTTFLLRGFRNVGAWRLQLHQAIPMWRALYYMSDSVTDAILGWTSWAQKPAPTHMVSNDDGGTKNRRVAPSGKDLVESTVNFGNDAGCSPIWTHGRWIVASCLGSSLFSRIMIQGRANIHPKLFTNTTKMLKKWTETLGASLMWWVSAVDVSTKIALVVIINQFWFCWHFDKTPQMRHFAGPQVSTIEYQE